MRDESSTLTAAQKAGGKALYKAVFTKSGQSTRTYGCDTTNRIIRMTHPESERSQTAQILVDNREGNLSALNLTGYTCTISYGYNTSSGDEYSACAPLEVISQKDDTLLRQSDLLTSFGCAGVFNMMAEDEASENYSPEDTNTDTGKTLLTAIANATMACFSHCKNYTIVFDATEETLIDSFYPADYFQVAFKESRLSAFKRVLGWFKSVARVERNTTSGAAEIHVLNPTITGSTYDYEYDDVVTGHNFFEKSVRNRLVIPNRIYVSSHPDHSPQYSGSDNDSTSYGALGRYVNEYHWLRTTGTTQCDDIATAVLQGYQVGQELGHGYAPLNVYQEVMDYVNITDSVASDERAGNIGYLNRITGPGVFEFEFRFGALELGSTAGVIPPQAIKQFDPAQPMVENMNIMANYILNLDDRTRDLQALLNQIINYLIAREEVVPKLHVTDQLIIPVIT